MILPKLNLNYEISIKPGSTYSLDELFKFELGSGYSLFYYAKLAIKSSADFTLNGANAPREIDEGWSGVYWHTVHPDYKEHVTSATSGMNCAPAAGASITFSQDWSSNDFISIAFQSVVDLDSEPYNGSGIEQHIFNGDFSWDLGSGLFDDTANVVDFNDLDADQQDAINAGEDVYHAGDGADVVTLPNSVLAASDAKFTLGSTFYGETGGDKITGGELDDRIDGGIGNDTIKGGSGKDVAVFSGNFKNYDFTYHSTTAGGGTVVTVEAKQGSDGQDVLTDIEFAQFADQKVPLAKWEFKVSRQQDGKAEIAFHENGKKLYETSASVPTDCAYDDATPIRVGTYEAMYRTKGSVNSESRIELSSYDGTSTVAGRTAIQIHVGNKTLDSQGCIVASNSTFLNKVRARIDEALTEMNEVEAPNGPQVFYPLPVPISVEVIGNVPQPKLHMPEDSSIADRSTNFAFVPELQFKRYGDIDGITKKAVVTFTVAGSADYGEDYRFGAGVTKVADNTFKLVFEANKAKDALPIIIIPDRGSSPEGLEAIRLNAIDIDLFNDNNGYVENSGKKLFGLVGGDNTYNLTIEADAARASHQSVAAVEIQGASAGDDTFVFSSSSGRLRIADFEAGKGSQDVIRIDEGLISSFDDLVDRAVEHHGDAGFRTVISVDADTKLVLHDVRLASLHHDDFAFV